jgi:hypothetical protein
MSRSYFIVITKTRIIIYHQMLLKDISILLIVMNNLYTYIIVAIEMPSPWRQPGHDFVYYLLT